MNKYIDHTLLKPEATKNQIEKLCLEAKEHYFASVCINPCWVKTCYDILKDTNVLVCTVIGFPLGANTSETKAFEAKDALNNGASEFDMVINIGALKDQDYDYVLNDIKLVKHAIGNHTLKVIIETCLLTKEEIKKACELALEAKADFVKTSTGFSTGGALVEDVALMKEVVKDKVKVKASGGIRTPEEFKKMIDAGANRIGTSNGVALIK